MSAQNISQRIKSARIMCGLSMNELCSKLGNAVSKQAISKYESGQMTPSAAVLSAMADAMGVGLDFFCRSTCVEVKSVNYRKKSSLGKKSQMRILAICCDRIERYKELESLVLDNVAFTNPIEDIVVSMNTDMEDVALALRKQWWVGKAVLPNIADLFEDKGIKVLFVNEETDFDGMTIMLKGDAAPVIVVNESMPTERVRFTLMHELGHSLIRFADDVPENERERFCHRFASIMLLPKELMLHDLGMHRRHISLQELFALKKTYGASVAAIMMRARDLGIITPSYYKTFVIKCLNKNRTEEGWGEYDGKEYPSRFRQLLFRATSEEIISMSRAAELSGRNLADFRNEYFHAI